MKHSPTRLDLPYVGIPTFMRRPYVPDWRLIDADVAFLGAPYDLGTQVRTGSREGPRAVREASMLFGVLDEGLYDHETGKTYLDPELVRIVDIGDADMVHSDPLGSLDAIRAGVAAILSAGALPVVVGGDHSVHIPCITAFAGQEPVHIVHIDAHLDYVDERAGVRFGQGNPLRRAAEFDHVQSITHIGIRNQGSSSSADFAAALAAKSRIFSVRQFRRAGIDAVLAGIPKGARIYLTIDVDGFDPSIASGTGTPSCGGLLYYETCEFLERLAAHGEVVGVDFVEISPMHDPSGATPIFVAQVLANLLAYVFDAQSNRGMGKRIAEHFGNDA